MPIKISNNNLSERISKKLGFTLLEVIIAITVLLAGTVGLLTLANFTIANSKSSADYLIAANLAQEGIEAFRYDRDRLNNWTQGWFLARAEGDYIIVLSSEPPHEKAPSSPDPSFYRLYYDDDNGMYNHDGDGQSTKFYRKVTNYSNIDDTERTLISNVWWNDRGRDYTFIITSKVKDWR